MATMIQRLTSNWAIGTLLLGALASGGLHAGEADAKDASRAVALNWLALIDDGQFAESWTEASSLFRRSIAQADWVHAIRSVRGPIGGLVSRQLASATYTETLPGAPDGEYVVMQFKASFRHKAEAIETVTTMKDEDGTWRVSGYFIK